MTSAQSRLPLVGLRADDTEIGHYAALLDTLNIGLAVFAGDGSLHFCNAQASAMIGEKPIAWVDENGQRLVDEEHLEMQVVHTGEPVRQRALGIRDNDSGATAWYRASAFPVFGEDGRLRRVLLTMTDLSVHSRMTSASRQLPTHDPVSGVFNWRYVSLLLDDECRRAQRYGRPFALALVAIDDLTGIRQAEGAAGEERVLAEIGRLLCKSLREFDMVGRYESDAFLLILPNVRINEATIVVERLREQIEKTHLRDDGTPVTVSGGLTEYTGEDSAALIDCVRSLLNSARDADGNRLCVNLDLF